MSPPAPEQLTGTIEALYRSESGRVLATLVRLLGDLDLAEDHPHGDRSAPYRSPAGLATVIAIYGESFDLLLGRR